MGITGSSIKKDNVKKHATSDAHVKAVNLENKPKSVQDLYHNTVIGKAFKKAGSEEVERIKKLIDIAYLLAWKDKPMSFLDQEHGWTHPRGDLGYPATTLQGRIPQLVAHGGCFAAGTR